MTPVLENFLIKDKIPQSILLSGQVSLSEAQKLAKHILGNSPKVDTNTHPDLHTYIPEEKSDLHPIATMQELITETALPPFEGANKVFLIVDAEKMLSYASNALLKTIEEPNPDTYFILLSSKPDSLLPTLKCRLFPLHFSSNAKTPIDLTNAIGMALNNDWPALIEMIGTLEAEDPDALFEGFLRYAAQQKDVALFQKMSKEVTRCQTALLHNVKLSTVLLYLFFRI